MKLKVKTIAIIASLAFAAAVPVVIFLARSPVLVVTDLSFIPLYGMSRIRAEAMSSSLILFRRVITVPVSDDAGDDIVQFIVSEASSRPFCVIFPLRFVQAARIYREQNPQIPVIILEGRYPEGRNPALYAISRNTDDYFLYRTDIEADFHRAALAAALLDGETNSRVVVFLESHNQQQGTEVFSQTLKDIEKPLQTSYFTTFSQFSRNTELSCVVLAGIGADYLDRFTDVPVIFFTWIDPALIPIDVVLVFNDSPWVQTVPAVRMAAAGIKTGQIPSKPVFLQGKNIDKEVLRNLRKIR